MSPVFKRYLLGFLKLWTMDARALMARRRAAALRDISSQAMRTRLESQWRRAHYVRVRANVEAWHAVALLARRPGAWLQQGVDVLTFILKMLSMFWGGSAALLFGWCLLTGSPMDSVSPIGIAAAAVFMTLWQFVCLTYWALTGRMPIDSPFVTAWRRRFNDVVMSRAPGKLE